MAGTNAVPGTSRGISGDGCDDGEDEDDVFLPPKVTWDPFDSTFSIACSNGLSYWRVSDSN